NSIIINSPSKPVVSQYIGMRKIPRNKQKAARVSKINCMGASIDDIDADKAKKDLTTSGALDVF
ncbi:hypothetical protein C7B72_22345, partial [Bacillus halotolerans]